MGFSNNSNISPIIIKCCPVTATPTVTPTNTVTPTTTPPEQSPSATPTVTPTNDSGCDYIPASVDWRNLNHYESGGGLIEIDADSQQITGITCDITIKVEYDNTKHTVYYKISNSSITWNNGPFDNTGQMISSNTELTSIVNNGTFTISNNQYLLFTSWPIGSLPDTINIKNVSDNDNLLDSITVNIS